MKRLGLIVNPIAGIGGKVGLKGSDGVDTLQRALLLGGEFESGKKASVALTQLGTLNKGFELYTCSGAMGAEACQRVGLPCTVVGEPCVTHTGPEDTMRAARALQRLDLDLLLFAGGDGTARDILKAVGQEVTVLGIPTGCKIHSGVYALTPQAAGLLARQCVQGRIHGAKEAEVMDIDEDLFRHGVVQARLYGYLKIPDDEALVQRTKIGGSGSSSVEALARFVAGQWQNDTLYIVGTGSTTAAVMRELGLPNTLLGVDLVYDKRVVALDCTEKRILEAVQEYDRVKIIVTIIGGQGCLFGRGNQQISAEVLRRVGRDNVIVAAGRDKVLSLKGRPLYVDTGDEEVDRSLAGYMKVVIGCEEFTVLKVAGVAL